LMGTVAGQAIVVGDIYRHPTLNRHLRIGSQLCVRPRFAPGLFLDSSHL
jgi:hypothetical protein